MIALAILLASFGVTRNVSAQTPVVFPEGFCQNTNGVPVNANSPLPAQNPCPAGTTFEVVSYEAKSAPGSFASEVTVFSSYDEMYQSLLSGIVWAKSGASPATSATTASATPVPPASGEVDYDDFAECATLATREARLKCWDPAYRAGGAAGWITALGLNGLVTHDARQPDEVVLPPQTVRGVQVTVADMNVSWPYACLTTDVAQRFVTRDSSIVYEIPGTIPTVFMATNVIANGPVSIWADCSDWEGFLSLTSTLATTDANTTNGTTATETGANTTDTTGANTTADTTESTLDQLEAQKAEIEAKLADLKSQREANEAAAADLDTTNTQTGEPVDWIPIVASILVAIVLGAAVYFIGFTRNLALTVIGMIFAAAMIVVAFTNELVGPEWVWALVAAVIFLWGMWDVFGDRIHNFRARRAAPATPLADSLTPPDAPTTG